MTSAVAPDPEALWTDADLIAALLSVDPAGLGGVAVRSGFGAVRERWLGLLRARLPGHAPVVRIPIHVGEDRLLGGLDLTASLSQGRPVAQGGLLAACHGGVGVLAMAERLDVTASALIASTLDQGAVLAQRDGLTLREVTSFGLVALDEGADETERPPEGLMDRLAFHLDLSGLSHRDVAAANFTPEAVETARRIYPSVAKVDDDLIDAVCEAAALVGVSSARSCLLALRVARVHAALSGRLTATAEDASVAGRLVLAPRAKHAMAERAPQGQQTEPNEEASHAPQPPSSGETSETASPPDLDETAARDLAAEMIVAAVRAALPDAFKLVDPSGRASAASISRSRGGGAAVKSALRGRPLGSRPGRLKPGARLDLLDTLRAAAPWQKLRAAGEDAGRLRIRKDDFRIRRYVQRAELTTILVVDASGSTAFQRLAEAKGAVEPLLAQAYVARARVALIAFHHGEASLLLPPTRSLTRAKRLLADLPGGGGTPFASAIDLSLAVAVAEKSKQRTPMLVFLTDGRANIDRAGQPGRQAADRDALAAAKRVAQYGVRALFIDTSPRPQAGADRFAQAMRGSYASLPFVQSDRLADLVAREGRAVMS